MTRCLDDELLLDVAEGRRALDRATQEHLAGCAACRKVLAFAAEGAGGTLADAAPIDLSEPIWEELGQGVVVGKRYELVRFLGVGGMGAVWAAKRVDDGAPFALKIARSADEAAAKRFEREGKIAERLRHPNVARLYEVIPRSEGRGVCLVQELVQGETLDAALNRAGSFSLDETARIAVAIAEALSAAHALGIVHRDLKPQNVMLTETRTVVLDFGVAKLLPAWGEHTRLTATGALLGTPRYMAPEQVYGEPDVDTRADVWALGAVIFRMLAGRAPVSGNTIGEVMKELRAGVAPDLASVVPGLPPDVVAVVRCALTLDRVARESDPRAIVNVMARYARVSR